MTAPATPLALAFDIHNASIREAADHIKARADETLGVVKVGSNDTGVGAVTISLADKPDWDTRAASEIIQLHEGEYTLYPNIPPIPAVTSRYRFRGVDSATPTPATVTKDLLVTSDVPTGWSLVDAGTARPAVLVQDSVWQLLDHGDETLHDVGRQRNRRLQWSLRVNATDYRLLFQWKLSYTGYAGGWNVKEYPPNYNSQQICKEVLSGTSDVPFCSPAEADALWPRIVAHFPPYRIK